MFAARTNTDITYTNKNHRDTSRDLPQKPLTVMVYVNGLKYAWYVSVSLEEPSFIHRRP